MALKHVPRSMRGDFDAMLRQIGRADDIEATDGPSQIHAPPGAIGPVTQTVVVRSRRTGIERTYVAGSSITDNGLPGWVNEVATDIRAGAFDQR